MLFGVDHDEGARLVKVSLTRLWRRLVVWVIARIDRQLSDDVKPVSCRIDGRTGKILSIKSGEGGDVLAIWRRGVGFDYRGGSCPIIWADSGNPCLGATRPLRLISELADDYLERALCICLMSQ